MNARFFKITGHIIDIPREILELKNNGNIDKRNRQLLIDTYSDLPMKELIEFIDSLCNHHGGIAGDIGIDIYYIGNTSNDYGKPFREYREKRKSKRFQ